jgi:8-oxo-dGTP pyrophosphatase MutT (NUDIX family)
LLVEAVAREVREEAGLDVSVDHITGLYDERDMNFLHVVFRCHPTEPGAEPRADLDEVSACAYWTPDALPRPSSDYTARRIGDALQASKGALPVIVHERNWFE